MANHPNRRGKFELVFVGSPRGTTRVRRFWQSYEAAEARALEVLARIENRAAHPAIIYGPGCGRDGRTVA